MAGKDKEMMRECIAKAPAIFKEFSCAHPLDREILDLIKELLTSIGDDNSDYAMYRYQGQANKLWKLLIEKAVKCLRFFDNREPFIKNSNKKPKAYGIDELAEYFNKYSEFERMLYGSSKYYRDHVIHVIRTWLTGVECLVKNGGTYLDFINIETGTITLNRVEKISIWTIIALTHDLGYPLEKARDIITTTRSMMETFVTNPDISMDLAFHGVQNYMNDFIVRLMSSKMIHAPSQSRLSGQEKMDKNDDTTENNVEEKEYVARLQPKYYFKFQKSLEKMQHGIISTLVVYKLLTYFIESDYNINEDYHFKEEDRRQFYIRREILRSIASHTCNDIYHLYLGSFAFLLIIADDTQEWGRKYISELYVDSSNEHEVGEIEINIAKTEEHNNICKFDEKIKTIENKGVDFIVSLIERLVKQSQTYVTIFRDGQDTENRDFSFERNYTIEYGSPKIIFNLCLSIPKDEGSKLTGNIKYSTTDTANKVFAESFRGLLQDEIKLKVTLTGTDANGKQIDFKTLANAGEWRDGTLVIDLMQ